MQMATASEAMQAAKPLSATEPVNKGKVWLLLCGGAAGLFALAVLTENNESFFPAIARANQALAEQRKRVSEEDNMYQDTSGRIDATMQEPMESTEKAVLEGIKAARDRAKQDK
jgi:hypothetical protein